jgi:carbamoyl-phosphate synthase large subunit
MKRVLRDGDTYQAFVVRDAIIESCVRAAAEALQPFGACNFQLRVRDSVPYIFEINARCSGTTYCRTLAGFNEPLMIADYLVHGRQPAFEIREITVLRYWKELVVRNDRIEMLRQAGSIDGVQQCL